MGENSRKISCSVPILIQGGVRGNTVKLRIPPFEKGGQGGFKLVGWIRRVFLRRHPPNLKRCMTLSLMHPTSQCH